MEESGHERKQHKLQMLSDFATVRFQLKSNKLYQANPQNKKPVFSRFSKSKPKMAETAPVGQVAAQIQNTGDNIHSIHQMIQDKKGEKKPESDSNFKLKYLQKLSNQHLLIGNSYQLDMLKIQTLKGNFIDVEYKWSICPSDLITSISIDPKYSMIGVTLAKTVDILKYNLKREQECPEVIIKHKYDQDAQYVRFVRNMSLFVILQTKLHFYRINIVCEKPELDLIFTYKMDHGHNFKLYHVPQALDNTLSLYYYENRVKPEQRSKFGLWMQTIEAHTTQIPKVTKMQLYYNIKVSERKEFSISSYNKDICLIKFRYNIIAVKNGFVLDQTNTNFRGENSFIQFIEQSQTVVHFRKTFMDIYRFSMNFDVKPEVIKLDCLDSIAFENPKDTRLFRIIELEPQTYAFFYQYPTVNTKDKPHLMYSFCISHEANLNSKIDMLYPKKEEIENGTLESFEDTHMQAKKLGMDTKKIYYELWKRSQKNNKIDFQILIATEDYPTIEKEIQRKLKNHSMSIRDVINIYKEALDMLKIKVKGPKCTVNTLIYYSSCQFALRKLEMMRYLKNLQAPKDVEPQFQADGQDQSFKGNNILFITIKDYYEYAEMELIGQFMENLTNYLQKKTDARLNKMKAILSYFTLIFRMAYLDIIDKIINLCKLRFREILEELPQLLPYRYEDPAQGFKLWLPVSSVEQQNNLFLNQLMTIDNKEQLEEFPNHIWYRRHINISHGVILVKKEEIDSYIQKRNHEERIFYKVFCLLYNLRIYDQTLAGTIHHIEEKYPLLPSHLNGKFQLYVILYEIFQSFHSSHNLQEFLSYTESQLFRMYFQREKAEKGGFILKKIMPLYETILTNGKLTGKDEFNNGLYNYFSSQDSSVADLKSILNKLNNQKNEFHIKAQKMYEVLVNAIMKKIKIGSEHDTPIDQILVYIQNIPFPIHNHSIMMNLEYIQQINYESEMLNKIRANMTLQEIVDNPKRVIEMMVRYEVQRHELHTIKSYRSLKVHTYKIMAEVQCRKSNIYGPQEHDHAFKIYLIEIMTTRDMIQLCTKLIKDDYLVKQFNIYRDFVQEVVIVLYHWKQSTTCGQKRSYFLMHLEYLQALVELLEPGNSRRKYIQHSIRYAQLLSFEDGFKIDYPLFSIKVGYPTLKDFVNTINCLTSKEMRQLNLQAIFDIIISLKKLQEDQILQSQQLKIYEQKLKVEVYEQLIIRLIEEKQLKAALDNIFILLQIPRDFSQYNIVFICLIIEQLLPQLLKKSIGLITKIVSYYFNYPLELAEIIRHLFSTAFSNQEIDEYLQKKIEKYRKEPVFSLQNPIVASKLKEFKGKNFNELNILFQLCLQRMIKHNELYLKNYHLHIMYRLMCHSPLILSKYIYCKKKGINLKTIRSFISYMSVQPLFDRQQTIQHGRQVFQIISFHYTHNVFFSQILKWHTKLSFQQMNQAAASNVNVSDDDHALDLLQECVETFSKKLSDIEQDSNQSQTPREEINYNELITNPHKYFEKPLSHYMYKDKDDGYESRNDEFFVATPRKVKQQTGKMVSQKPNSIDSKHSGIGDDHLLIPSKNPHKVRKYSEYFPQMFDLEQLGISSDEKQKVDIYTPRERRTFDFTVPRLPENKIEEDEQEIYGSYACINIGQKPLKNRAENDKTSKVDNESPIILQSSSFQKNKPKAERAVSIRSRFSEEMSHADSVEIHSRNTQNEGKSEVQGEGGEGGGFQYVVNVVQKSFSHIPIVDMADKLFSTVVDSYGIFDLTLLKIQAHKSGFKQYLGDLLQQIYHEVLISFEKRLHLIIAIAQEYKPTYFKEECIQIFRKLLKSKIIPNLSFKIIQTVPIQLIFQQNERQSFRIFKKKILPKVDSINIYQAMEYVKHLFYNPLFIDQLLMEFIVQKIRESKGTIQEKERNETIILTLFDYLNHREKSIKDIVDDLNEGNEEDRKIATTIKRLSIS